MCFINTWAFGDNPPPSVNNNPAQSASLLARVARVWERLGGRRVAPPAGKLGSVCTAQGGQGGVGGSGQRLLEGVLKISTSFPQVGGRATWAQQPLRGERWGPGDALELSLIFQVRSKKPGLVADNNFALDLGLKGTCSPYLDRFFSFSFTNQTLTFQPRKVTGFNPVIGFNLVWINVLLR